MLTILVLAGAAAAWFSSPQRAPRTPAALPLEAPAAARPEEAPATPRELPARPASRPDTRAPIPADAVRDGRADPAFLRSYLEGRTPDEVWPDGTQVFHGMPFEVRQPDGTIRVVPVTLTLQPSELKAVPAEPAEPK